jgi:glycosyltransferase 2 family protein
VNRLRAVLLGCGVILFGVLLLRLGVQPVIDAFARLSWGVLLIVWFPFVLINACDTLGWRFAFPRHRPPFRTLLTARLAGEAFNATTPGASVAGEPIKALLIRDHVTYNESAASLVLAKTTITISQVLFLAAGLALMPHRGVDPRLFHGLFIALAIEVAATGAFVLVQTTRMLGAVAALLARLGLKALAEGSVIADGQIKGYYRDRPAALTLSIGMHFLGWVLSAGEALLIFTLLGISVSLPTVVGIEAAGTAVRFATFFVPSHIGALEGGNVITFAAFGLDPAAGLTFTLIRRVRELAWIAAGVLFVAYRNTPAIQGPAPTRGA